MMDYDQEEYMPINETTNLHSNSTSRSIQIFIQNKDKTATSVPKYSALIKRKEIQKPLLSAFDTALSLLLLSPCVVGFWRGVWHLQDIYKYLFPPWLCITLGLFIYVLCAIIQDFLVDFLKKNSNRKIKIVNFTVTRTYTYVFAIGSIMHWRGGWIYMDQLLGVQYNEKGIVSKKGSGLLIIITMMCFFSILALRSLRSSAAPPFVFCTDRKSNTFIIPTRFKTKFLVGGISNDFFQRKMVLIVPGIWMNNFHLMFKTLTMYIAQLPW